MALPSVLLGVGLKMEAVLAIVVVGVEGPLVAVMVVALPLEPEGRVAMEGEGVLVLEARFRTLLPNDGTGVTVVTPV